MMQLLYEATILGYRLDMNAYLKMIIAMYFDHEIPYDRKEVIMHLYILLAKDTNDETLNFCTELLTEYINSNSADHMDPNGESRHKRFSSKKMNKKDGSQYAKTN